MFFDKPEHHGGSALKIDESGDFIVRDIFVVKGRSMICPNSNEDPVLVYA